MNVSDIIPQTAAYTYALVISCSPPIITMSFSQTNIDNSEMQICKDLKRAYYSILPPAAGTARKREDVGLNMTSVTLHSCSESVWF